MTIEDRIDEILDPLIHDYVQYVQMAIEDGDIPMTLDEFNSAMEQHQAEMESLNQKSS